MERKEETKEVSKSLDAALRGAFGFVGFLPVSA